MCTYLSFISPVGLSTMSFIIISFFIPLWVSHLGFKTILNPGWVFMFEFPVGCLLYTYIKSQLGVHLISESQLGTLSFTFPGWEYFHFISFPGWDFFRLHFSVGNSFLSISQLGIQLPFQAEIHLSYPILFQNNVVEGLRSYTFANWPHYASSSSLVPW